MNGAWDGQGWVPEQIQTEDTRMIFFVEGRPAPQGSKSPGKYGFRESSKYLPAWRNAVKKATSDYVDGLALFDAIDQPVRVQTFFYVAPPKHTKATHPVASSIGDGDKFTRAVWDGLVKGGLLADDRFIVQWSGGKDWAGAERPGCLVVVEVLR